jgi:LAO/AO transport system kinase
MEIPDVLVVTKADLGQIAMRTRRDLVSALRSLGSSDATRVVAVSSLPPASGVAELLAALDEHRADADIPARRVRARRAGALLDFAAEHGEAGLRTLGGRRTAIALLDEQDPSLSPSALLAILEQHRAG